MGFLSDIFGFLTSLADDNTYIEEAKDWGDNVWRSVSNKEHGTLSLYQVDGRLYKRMKIGFYNKNVAVFTDKEDRGLLNFDSRLSRGQKDQLNEQGYICLKRYN